MNLLLRLKYSFHMGAFNVHMFSLIGHQAASARSSVFGTIIQDFTSVTTLRNLDTLPFCCFTARVSGDPVSSALGRDGVEISDPANAACAVLLDSSEQLFVCGSVKRL